MGRLNWLDKFPQPTEKKTGPRNWDACWKIDAIDENGIVIGQRMTSPPFDRMPFYALKKGRIKVFPQALVLITTTSEYFFGGLVFLGAAVYDEVELEE
jgi:hypothetical protein